MTQELAKTVGEIEELEARLTRARMEEASLKRYADERYAAFKNAETKWKEALEAWAPYGNKVYELERQLDRMKMREQLREELKHEHTN